jgi:hypothetical protein
LVAVVGIGACSIIPDGGNADVYGVSVYGVHMTTLPVYGATYLLCAYFLLRAGNSVALGRHERLVKVALWGTGAGLALLLITPFTIDTFFNWTHMVIGAAFFAFDMFVGAVLACSGARSRWVIVAVVVELTGGLLSAGSLPDHALTLMIQGEALFQLGFALILELWLRDADRARPLGAVSLDHQVER